MVPADLDILIQQGGGMPLEFKESLSSSFAREIAALANTIGGKRVPETNRRCPVMPKIDVTKTELVWPGKYDEDGTRKEVPRVNLPFQIIETVNESRATREAKKSGVQGSLFDVYEGNEGDTYEEGWKNKLIWGDNLLVMGSLLEKFAGKIDLIYIDPPFATGADFSFTAEIGDGSIRLDKEASVVEEKAYRDTWGRGLVSYMQMMRERLTLIRSLMSQEGHLSRSCRS